MSFFHYVSNILEISLSLASIFFYYKIKPSQTFKQLTKFIENFIKFLEISFLKKRSKEKERKKTRGENKFKNQKKEIISKIITSWKKKRN